MTKEELIHLKTDIDSYIEARTEMSMMMCCYSVPKEAPKSTSSRRREPENISYCLDYVDLPPKEKTFQEALFEYLDEKKIDDVQFYKTAHIDRKLFSKIRSNPDYKPNIITAVCAALALKLDIQETRRLLERANLALSRSRTWDLIISYCIEHKIYDLMEINEILVEYKEPLLYI